MSLFSQKLQNAQALVNSFYKSLRKDDIHEFRDIIMLRGEAAGGDNIGHYVREDGQLHDFSLYFAEGAPDGGALERIVYNLSRVCFFANKESVNLQFFYSELGHYIRICYEICEAINDVDENDIRVVREGDCYYLGMYGNNVPIYFNDKTQKSIVFTKDGIPNYQLAFETNRRGKIIDMTITDVYDSKKHIWYEK